MSGWCAANQGVVSVCGTQQTIYWSCGLQSSSEVACCALQCLLISAHLLSCSARMPPHRSPAQLASSLGRPMQRFLSQMLTVHAPPDKLFEFSGSAMGCWQISCILQARCNAFCAADMTVTKRHALHVHAHAWHMLASCLHTRACWRWCQAR